MCVYVRKSAQAGFGSTAGWGIILVNTYMVCDERHGQIDILMCSSHITDKNKIPKIISLYPTCLLSLPHNMYMLLCMRNRGASRSGDHEIDIEFYNKRRSRDTIHATGEARATASSEAVARTTGAQSHHSHSHSGAHPLPNPTSPPRPAPTRPDPPRPERI